MITRMPKQPTQASQPKQRKASVAKVSAMNATVSKEARYRAAMKRRGFRLVSMWVPDTNSARFRNEARRQSLLVARHEDPRINGFLDAALAQIEGWTG